jgi:hypothetical protein
LISSSSESYWAGTTAETPCGSACAEASAIDGGVTFVDCAVNALSMPAKKITLKAISGSQTMNETRTVFTPREMISHMSDVSGQSGSFLLP